MANAGIDQNNRNTLTAISSADNSTIVRLYADPTTHRLLVDSTGGGTGITSINADTTAAQIIAAGTGITVTDNGTGTHTIAATGSGGVSSVGNVDSTLTISPTTGAVVASINLANANTWTATQTFSNATYSALFTGGNVGIGTTAPLLNLGITGAYPGIIITDGGSQVISFQSNNVGAALMRANVYRNSSGVDIVPNTANSQWDFLMIPSNNSSTESFSIRRSPPAASPTFASLMVMNSTGQVSFGTGTNPNASIEVSGTQNARMRMSLIANNNDGMYAYSATPTHIFSFTRQNSIVNNADLLISSLGGIGFKGNVSAPGTTYDMFLSTSGKFGVGVTVPTAFVHPAASSTATASLRIPAGTAPTSPNDGDMWNDSVAHHLYVRLNGSTLQLDGQNSSLTWTTVTGTSQTMSVANGYISNNASLVTLTLPSTATVGSVIEILNQGAGLFKIAQVASQIIHFGNTNTTTGTGGSITALNVGDSISLRCLIANTDWQVIGSVGNFTMV